MSRSPEGIPFPTTVLENRPFITAYLNGFPARETDPVVVFSRGENVFTVYAFQEQGSQHTSFVTSMQDQVQTLASMHGALNEEIVFSSFSIANFTQMSPNRYGYGHIKGLVGQTIEELLMQRKLNRWISSADIPFHLSGFARNMYRKLETRQNGLCVVQNEKREYEVFRND